MKKASLSRILAILFIPLLGCRIITGAGTLTPTLPASSPEAQGATVPAAPTLLAETPAPVPAATRAALWIEVVSPLDGAVVNTSQIEVVGSAPAGAVITIGDQILIVGADGRFKAALSLEEGPNVIEVAASDVQGNETTLILTVTYEP